MLRGLYTGKILAPDNGALVADILKPINSILYRCTGAIIDKKERYAFRSAEVYMCLEQNAVFICQLPLKTCRYIKNLLRLIKALYLTAVYIGG